MSAKYAFGVGCFNFVIRKEPPFTITFAEYMAEVSKTLEAIPSVSNISIDYEDDHEHSLTAHEGDSVENLEQLYFLGGSFFDLSFDLYIPHRLKEKLVGDVAASEISAEHFRITVVDAFHLPITFVEPIGGSSSNDPSSCVQLVREYLYEQMNSLDQAVKLTCLGPSPFHADFFVTWKNAPTPSIEVNVDRSPPYHAITFCLATPDAAALTANPSIAKERFMWAVKEELSIYYWVMDVRSKMIDDWGAIELKLQKLVRPSTPNWRSKVRNYVKKGRAIDDLFTSIVEFDASDIVIRNEIDESYKNEYKSGSVCYLKEYIDSGIEDLRKYPSKQIAELLTFLEKRRSKAMEFLVVLIAGSIGGIAGAVATILATAK